MGKNKLPLMEGASKSPSGSIVSYSWAPLNNNNNNNNNSIIYNFER